MMVKFFERKGDESLEKFEERINSWFKTNVVRETKIQTHVTTERQNNRQGFFPTITIFYTK